MDMTPTNLTEAARAVGVSLRVRIFAEGADRLPEEVREAIKAKEADVVRHLVDPTIIVLCARCGGSRQFVAIENPTGWTCSNCSPDWQYERDERAAIIAESAIADGIAA